MNLERKLSDLLLDIDDNEGHHDLNGCDCNKKLLTTPAYIDKYGFDHNWKSDEITIKNLINQSRYEEEVLQDEWNQLLKNQCQDNIKNLSKVLNHDSFLELLSQGVPSNLRKDVWLILFDCNKLEFKREYYSRVSKEDLPLINYQTEIKLDLERTFPNHPKSKDEKFKEQIQRILLVYSITNPAVEDEENTYLCLCSIVETIAQEYYTTTMLGAQVDQNVLSDLLTDFFPDLTKRMKSIGALLPVFSMEWFLCLFSTSLPPQLFLIIWDNLFLRKSRVLFEIALSLIELFESDLMLAKSHSDVALILAKITHQDLFKCIQQSYKRIGSVLSKKKIQDLRLKHWTITKKIVKDSVDEKELKFLMKTTPFSIEKLKSLKEEFEILSQDGTGIGFLQFQQLVLSFLPDWNDMSILLNLFNSMDDDLNNILSFKEVVKGLAHLSHGTFNQKLEGNKGYLTRLELKSLVDHVYKVYFEPQFKNLDEQLKQQHLQKKQDFLNNLSLDSTTFQELKKIAIENTSIFQLPQNPTTINNCGGVS
eukprot:gene5103-6351_t